MTVELTREHRWLEQLLGEWTFEIEAVMGPGPPPTTSAGTERVRSLDGAWVICEGTNEMPGGGTGTTMMTLGYDPARGRFVGTFVGSMMTNLWLYEGTLDEAGRVLTLDTVGPSFSGDGTTVPYRDIIEVEGDGRRVLRSSVREADGTWTPFMTARYRRTD